MFTVQPSAHPSLHGICGHDSDSVTSGASDQDALFEIGSTTSTCTVPHKSEFGVSLEMDVDADFTLKNPFSVFGESASECRIALEKRQPTKKSVAQGCFRSLGCSDVTNPSESSCREIVRN